jgi:DNA polymerase IV
MIIHVDMDAFYASVEQRDRPELLGLPVVVGGDAKRGVVLAASYEARPYGVRSAMPMAQAVRLLPKHAQVVPPRFPAYVEASEAVFHIFESVTPLVETLSLDEAFLDVTASASLFGAPEKIASHLRARIQKELHLNASAGIAPIKFVAKIASDFAKPNGQKLVSAEAVLTFLHPLPISRLWGVGAKTEQILKGLGYHTIGDVARASVEQLQQRLGKQAQHFFDLSRGIDLRRVETDREAKSVGSQDTFESDLTKRDELSARIHSQALRVGRRLRKAQLLARTVQLTVKYSDFSQVTRQKTLAEATDDGQELYRQAKSLLQALEVKNGIRLTGVAASEFQAPALNLNLFAEVKTHPRAHKLNAALDAITSRFGTDAVTTADLVTQSTEGRDGFYREEKREALKPRGPTVERDE